MFNKKLNKDFISNYFDKQYLYKKEMFENTSNIMSLYILNNILAISSNWNNKNLIKYNDYSSLSEQGGDFLRPDLEKVQNWVSKGASIILNDINTVNSGILIIKIQRKKI